MERSKSQLLELTRCGLWSVEPNISLFEGGVDWVELLRLAKEQTLMGVVSSSIEKLPPSLRPSRVEGLRLHQMVTLNRQYRAHHVEVLAKVLELLRRAGVERPVLLKGLGVGMNYPDPTLRQCGDIDIYIGEELYSKVWDFICVELEIERDESHALHHFDFIYMDTTIEIHKYVVDLGSISFRSREFLAWSKDQLEGDELRELSIDGVNVYLPPYNFDFIFIFYHTWRHFLTGGVGLRQLCDWACYIDSFSDKFDRKELIRFIHLFKLYTPISLFATILVKELGVSPNKFSGYISSTDRRYKRVLARIWQGGNFGYYREGRSFSSRTVLERKWSSFKAQFHDMIFMFSIDWLYAIKFYIPFFATRIGNAIKNRKKLGDKL